MVLSSAVLSADRGDRDQAMAEMTNPTGGGGAADFDEFGGVDPNLDPELAMVCSTFCLCLTQLNGLTSV